jgi:hypothetical protein
LLDKVDARRKIDEKLKLNKKRLKPGLRRAKVTVASRSFSSSHLIFFTLMPNSSAFANKSFTFALFTLTPFFTAFTNKAPSPSFSFAADKLIFKNEHTVYTSFISIKAGFDINILKDIVFGWTNNLMKTGIFYGR